MFALSWNNGLTKLCALVGFCLSMYALYVEVSLENNPIYKPFCDVKEYVKCSSAFLSPYAKGFGIIRYVFGKDTLLNVPNGLTGMVYYALMFALSSSDNRRALDALYYLAIVSNLMTVYLACILVFVIRELCLVCVTTYLVNGLNLLCVLAKQKARGTGGKANAKKY
ncbi:vitamin K epoxide reductase complex subunit 1-like protein 1 [Adelges cooleyi]|uniref:vitamin K epoxide reductase complex subunit 1-like protein 1 n=1 Tax=Adelges cooleyi TaxID=133065 RepID=UPI0021801A15|nr:vitamin K epoxide reductase complex subunit 1-like protein 1 [Adelges cooleyi]